MLLIQILQVLIAPIPVQPISIASGYLFGAFWGFIIAYSGLVIGSFLAFYLGKVFGRPLVKRIVNKTVMDKYDGYVQKISTFILSLIYFLPLFPDDEITYILGMSKTRFQIKIEFVEDESGLVYIDGKKIYADQYGLDRIEFYISTNPGEEFKPLNKIVSGGEISRIMLALKSILADVDRIPTLIFDEIDLGVSGRIAQAVGRSGLDTGAAPDRAGCRSDRLPVRARRMARFS